MVPFSFIKEVFLLLYGFGYIYIYAINLERFNDVGPRFLLWTLKTVLLLAKLIKTGVLTVSNV